jgi:hypothetical protein
MTANPSSVAICVPTSRADAIQAFIGAWRPLWETDDGGSAVNLFVHEDRPQKTIDPAMLPARTRHTSNEDIGPVLGASGWIIPSGSGACRSFPMYLAWSAGCEYIITLDDDCYPHDGDAGSFVQRHLRAFTRDRWFRTIAGDEPRGIPYERLGRLAVRLNHGLWADVPDLDGPTSLVRIREPRTAVLPQGHDVVPPGMAFPLCAMNVCYHRSLIPAAYNLLMGLESVGLDRFDDIWSGVLLKRILDYMGWYAVSGEPFVRHVKRSNPFANLRREALGIEIHEHLWEYILDTPLDPGLTVAGAFKALARRVAAFPECHPALPCPPGYFPRLGDAMVTWAELFER